MKKRRVLLVSANTETLPAPVYPLALAYLAGAARKAGWEPVQCDTRISGRAGLAEKINSTGVSLVALSIRNIDNTDSGDARTYLGEYAAAMDVIRENTSAPIILGGGGLSIFPEAILDCLGADIAVVGAGEGPLAAVLKRIENGEDIRNNRPEIITGLDECRPSPFVRPLHDGEILRHYWETGGMIGVQTKRGCPRRCCYCTYPVIDGREVRLKDPAAVADEMEELSSDYGVNYFFFVDSVFNLERGHEEKIAAEILRRKLNVSWGAFFSPRGLNRDYLRAMKRSGLSHVELGADSLSDAVLAGYRKDFLSNDVLKAANACEDEDIHCALYFVFGGPCETIETIRETVERANALSRAVFFPFAGIRIYPGTGIFAAAAKKGVIEEGQDCLEPCFYFETGLDYDKIWEIVEDKAASRRNWILPKDYAGCRPALSLLRRAGRKGPLWEYVAGRAGRIDWWMENCNASCRIDTPS